MSGDLAVFCLFVCLFVCFVCFNAVAQYLAAFAVNKKTEWANENKPNGVLSEDKQAKVM